MNWRCAPRALLAGALLLGTPAPAAELSLSWDGVRLVLTGDSSSAAHEEIVDELAGVLFAEADYENRWRRAPSAPPGWSLLTEETLRALRATRHAQAQITASGVRIDGLYVDRASWQDSVRRVRRVLPDGMELVDGVSGISDAARFAAQCRARFDALTAGARVRFGLDSARPSPAARPLLDGLAELLADCPGSRLDIVGHTDGTGPEALNLALSRQRAEAVAGYLEARGIASERLAARGAGSGEPLVAGDTRAARAANRRIEFALRFAGPRPTG